MLVSGASTILTKKEQLDHGGKESHQPRILQARDKSKLKRFQVQHIVQ